MVRNAIQYVHLFICMVGNWIDSGWNWRSLSLSYTGIVFFFFFLPPLGVEFPEINQMSTILKILKEKCIVSGKIWSRDNYDYFFKLILSGRQLYKDINSTHWLKMGFIKLENMKNFVGYETMHRYIHTYIWLYTLVYVLSKTFSRFYVHLIILSNQEIDIFLWASQ